MSQPNREIEIKEYIAEKKIKWLRNNGMSFKDVLVDEEGEYVVEVDEMDEGEGGDYMSRKVYLPDFIADLKTITNGNNTERLIQ